MKKYVLGVCAIALALGLNSFTHKDGNSAKDPTYYWYSVNTGLGAQSNFQDADVVYLSGPLTIAAAPTNGCPAMEDFKCVVGFEEGQVDLSNHHLKSGSQASPVTKSFREDL